jgi:type IV pilus assembly protein PilQ
VQGDFYKTLAVKTTLLLLCCFVGCHGQERIHRKTVEDLYGEALSAAASRPPVIQQASTFDLQPNSYSCSQEESPRSREAGAKQIKKLLHGDSMDLGVASIQSPPRRETKQIEPSESSYSPNQAVLACVEEIVASPAGTEARVSEVFEQTDIREAIQILATAAGVEVVIDETVGGVTSAQIQDEYFEQALEKVLLPIGLVYAKHEEKYLVAPPDPDSPLFYLISQRYQYSPNFHDVAKLTSLLPARFKPYLQSSIERNIIVVDAPKAIGDDLIERLRELDAPVPQIELEAIVCVVSPDSGFRFGLDWGHVVGVQGVDSLKAGLTGLTFSGATSKQGASNAFSDFAVTSAFVRLLASEGYITIRAAPRVTAKDGEKANISINRETFFSLQPNNNSLLFQQNIQKVEAGISLEIIPRVHGDMISVKISKAEVSEDIRTSDSRSELTANPYPIINRRVVSTDVNVRDGQTIVIGGLVQRQTVDRINRIPGLSRIPIAGKLFQTIEKQEQDAEVAIFISPRIVNDQPCVLNEK